MQLNSKGVEMANQEIVYDVKGLIRDLEALEPGMKKALKDDAKSISADSLDALKRGIKLEVPLSGMDKTNNSGRLAWGQKIPANQVKFGMKTTRSNRRAITPLFKLTVTSPMTAIADTAGKGSGVPVRNRTKDYAYKGGTRTHRVTTQGRNMINVLRLRNRNNFVYPAVEKSLPMTERKLKLVLERYAAKVNRKLN